MPITLPLMLQAVGAPTPSKVPEVTLGFWLIKILATTLGETGGDAVTMSWLRADVVVNNGYLIGSAIFISALIVLVAIQISAKKFHPFLYWSVIVASTTAGTAMADFATRSLGIGYTGGSLLLFTCLMLCLARGIGQKGLSRSRQSTLRRLKPSTGLPSLSHKPWALHSEIGQQTQVA